VNEDCLKLTTYFGERDRSNGRLLADELIDVYEQHALRTSILLRGTEGFGKQTPPSNPASSECLSEDLPLVAIGVDSRHRVEPLIEELERRQLGGLLTVQRSRMLGGRIGVVGLPEDLQAVAKLTVYCGRRGHPWSNRPPSQLSSCFKATRPPARLFSSALTGRLTRCDGC